MPQFMKKRNRSTSRNPTQFKENDGPSVTDDGQADGNNGKSGW